MPVIALSTCYLQHKFKVNSYDMLYEAKQMGYDYVEISHSLPINAQEGVLKAVDEGFIKVASCHNFCPMPPVLSSKVPAPNIYSPASFNKKEAQLWLKYTLKTIEFAKQVKASAIVCHCGTLEHIFLPLDRNITKELKQDKPLSDIILSAKYQKIKEHYLKKSANKSQAYYKNIRQSLLKLEDSLKGSNINIAIENRDNAPELPFDWNLDKAHKDFFDDIAYTKSWHDIGHSKKRELYGLYNQEQLIKDTHKRIIGWHLQDCTNQGKDHLALGEGDVDFKRISKYFDKEKHLFIFELNNKQDRQKVIDSKKILEDLL